MVLLDKQTSILTGASLFFFWGILLSGFLFAVYMGFSLIGAYFMHLIFQMAYRLYFARLLGFWVLLGWCFSGLLVLGYGLLSVYG